MTDESLDFPSFLAAGLRSWDVLRHAVDFGYGGRTGAEKASWLEGVVVEFFALNSNLEPDEVEEFVAEIMNVEFNLITAEDSTLKFLCREFCSAFEFFTKHRADQVRREMVARTFSEFLRNSHKLAEISKNKTDENLESGSSSNSDCDDVDQCEESAGSSHQQLGQASGGRTNVKNPPNGPDEGGWTTVTRQPRKKRAKLPELPILPELSTENFYSDLDSTCSLKSCRCAFGLKGQAGGPPWSAMVFHLIPPMERDISALAEKTKSCDNLWQHMKEYQSQFIGKLGEIQRLRQFLSQTRQNLNGSVNANQAQVEKCQKFMEETSKQAGLVYQNLVETRKNILLTLKECADQVTVIRNDLVNNILLEWKKGQKLAQIGLPFERNVELLDKIANQFENLAEEMWQLRTYALWIKENLEQAPNLPDNNVELCLSVLTPIGSLLTRELDLLVKSSFVVSKQPNVVLKQHNKFTAETRLLIGEKLGIRFMNLKVGVKLVSEENARSLKDGSLDALNATTVAKIGMGDSNGGQQEIHMEVEREGRRVKACFKSRLLKVDPRKSGGKATDEQQQSLVCERNYALLFTCSPFAVNDINFPCLWTLSLPVKLTVHGSQERLSQAMILWDHAFAPAEAPFSVPDVVEWSQLADALQGKFKVHTGTARPLSKTDLEYLAEKLMGPATNQPSYQNVKISLARFCKDPMREDVEFSFWAWFFEIMCLIKQKLQKYWDDGLIKGFIGRQAASDLVLSQQQPSFLLRFSDTLLGGLSISFVAALEDGSREVLPLAPFTVKDLDHLSLTQRIAGCPSLLHIDLICGTDGCYERSLILKEGDGKRKEVNKDAHAYVVSELIMVVPSKSGSDLNVMSPSMANSASPDSNGFMQEIIYATEMNPTSPCESTSLMDNGGVKYDAASNIGENSNDPALFDISTLLDDPYLRGLNFLNLFDESNSCDADMFE